MKQKRHDDKRQNALNTRNKRTAPSSAYKRIKRATKDSQKRNLDNQTDNKGDNRNMSIGLGKEKKLKSKTMDQKAEKPISLKTVTTTSSSLTASSKSSPPSPQSEVFDSSNDNAMLEMKEVDNMRPDKTAKVFLHIEEKQLDLISTNINNSIKKTDSENILNTNLNPANLPAKVDLTLEKSDSGAAELIKEDVVTKVDIEQNNPQIYNELEEHNNLDESARFYGNENKESYSDLSNNGNINPFIVGIKLWQDHNIAWINAYNEFIKEWIGNIKIDPNNI
jgi:hypothetical protein